MKKLLYILLLMVLTFTSCYRGKSKEHDGMVKGDTLMLSPEQIRHLQDSISFYSTHHYTRNFNFVVTADSLPLFSHNPDEVLNDIDTSQLMIYHNQDLVVAEIRFIPIDSVDSVWVKVAHDQNTMGWVREGELLERVAPNDPISLFISTFSDFHLLLTLIFVAVIFIVYGIVYSIRHKAKIVHVNDIPSFYPTALVLVVALAATFYSSIQLFAPEIWKHYYYHPSLNPLTLPPLLAIFLTMVWLMPMLAIAAIDDAFRHLRFGEAVLYLCGLAATLLTIYVVFSVTTLYYVGYPLLAVYIIYSIKSFYSKRRLAYFCGKCGKAMHAKGKCPHCGAMNV